VTSHLVIEPAHQDGTRLAATPEPRAVTSPAVLVGPAPLGQRDVVEVARQGAGVRLTDPVLAVVAGSRAVIDALADQPGRCTASRPGSAP